MHVIYPSNHSFGTGLLLPILVRIAEDRVVQPTHIRLVLQLILELLDLRINKRFILGVCSRFPAHHTEVNPKHKHEQEHHMHQYLED